MADVDVDGIPVINPLGLDAYTRTRLYLMWANQGGTRRGYVWQDSADSAFEEWVEYLDDVCPGCFVSNDMFQERLDDAAKEHGFDSWADAEAKWLANPKHGKWAGWHNDMMEDYSKIVEAAEADLTIIGHTQLKNGSYIPSDEWGFDEITDKKTLREVWYASANAYEKQYGETLKPPRGLGELSGASKVLPKWAQPRRR